MTLSGSVRRIEPILDVRRYPTAAAIRQALDGAKTTGTDESSDTGCRPEEDGKGRLVDLRA